MDHRRFGQRETPPQNADLLIPFMRRTLFGVFCFQKIRMRAWTVWTNCVHGHSRPLFQSQLTNQDAFAGAFVNIGREEVPVRFSDYRDYSVPPLHNMELITPHKCHWCFFYVKGCESLICARQGVGPESQQISRWRMRATFRWQQKCPHGSLSIKNNFKNNSGLTSA
jgi:hypothetical protein